MTRRRAPYNSAVLPRPDEFGISTLAGAATWFTDRKRRQVVRGRIHFAHRTPNGVRDPFSFWHVVETLLNIGPDAEFGARQLANYLNENKPTMLWDAVTVGRILGDIAESCELANGNGLDIVPLLVRRNASGSWYRTTNQELGNQVLRNLLDDLTVLCEKLVQQEADGFFPRRLFSPLTECPSVSIEARQAA